MDGIAKLRGVSTWAYVQRNQSPSQGDETDKIFVYKMYEVGPGSAVDLVKHMQPGEILSMFGSCPTMSNASPSGPLWPATYTTEPTNAS